MKEEQTGISSLQAEIRRLRRRVGELEAEQLAYEQTRRDLREDSSFRKAVIERAAEGVCVCHEVPCEPFVRFTVWNSRMSELTGYTLEEINQHGWYQSLYPDPDVQEKARERMGRMRHGEDLRDEQWEIVRADGQRRTVAISTSVLTTEHGSTHVLALMHDVTEKERNRRRLEDEVRDLRELLPICASCKKVRNDDGYWQHVENYVREHFKAEFSHALCPECITRLYPDIPPPEEGWGAGRE